MILRTLWLRPMLANPTRFLLTVAGVAIGVASVVSTVLASRSAVSFLSRDVEQISGRALLEVTRPGGVALDALEELRAVADEVAASPVVEGTALAPAIGDLVRVLGIDLLVGGDLRDATLDTGARSEEDAFETLLMGDGAALSRRLADELGVGPGDRLELLVRSRPVMLDVAAVWEPERFASAWDRTVLVDVATGQELFERLDRVDRVELLPRAPDIDPEALAAALEGSLGEGYRVAPVSTRREEGERMVRALEFNLTALSGVSILVGIVLVATTLATSVVQRRRAISLLRSLGASRGQLAFAVLFEAGAIGTLGGIAGVVAGFFGARFALASVRASVASITQGPVTGEIALDPPFAAAGLALGVVSSLAAAVRPLGEALRTPPIQGLAAEHPESVVGRRWRSHAIAFAALVAGAAVFASLPPIGDRPIWALVAALLLLSALLVVAPPLVDLIAGVRLRITSVRVAQAALEAGRKRAAWAAGAVGVAVGLAVAMATMVGSFRQTVVDWTQQAMRSDLFVRPLRAESGLLASGLDREVVEVARELFGDEAVDPFHQDSARVDGQRVALAGAAFDVVASEGGVPFLDGRPSAEVFREAHDTGAAVVNEPFARRFDVEVGDTIELELPTGLATREVAGVYRDYSGHTGRVVLPLEDYLAHYPDEGPQSLAIFLPPERDVEEARDELQAALAGRHALDVLPNRVLRAEVLEVFEQTFAVTIALQLVASVVAGIAVITVLGALVRERRRELAVLRVLGGSRVQVAGVVVGEALLLGLAGALGGLVVGLAVGWILVAVVNVQSFGWTLRFLPPWGSIAWTVGAVIPACLLAGLIPAVLGARMTPREAFRESA